VLNLCNKLEAVGHRWCPRRIDASVIKCSIMSGCVNRRVEV
jgi:hypothetical protein